MTSKSKRSIQMSEGEFSDRTSSSSSETIGKEESRRESKYKRASSSVAAKKMREAFSDSEDSGDEEWTQNQGHDSSSSSSDSEDWSPSRKRPMSKSPMKHTQILKKSPKKISPSLPAREVVPKPLVQLDHSVEENAETSEPTNSKPGEKKEIVLHYFSGSLVIDSQSEDDHYDSGSFIMLKSDYKTQKIPSIWRIDGKNLLQKYESVSHNGGVGYRNISTYSSWSPSNRWLYVPVEVEVSSQSKSETIVSFDRNKILLLVWSEMMDTLNEEATAIIDTFQIYLQTMISQALDSNFLSEIVREKDDYFLSSIAVIEDQWILPKRDLLKETVALRKHLRELLDTFPEMELRCVTSGDKQCDACSGRNPTRSFEFLPYKYDPVTLDRIDIKTPPKSYRFCLTCADRAFLYHQLYHLRYHLFLACVAKINEYDRTNGPEALTACLADQNWKSLMHRRVLLLLAEAQQVVNHKNN